MAQNIGTLVTAAIRPNDSLDLIASAFANEIKGGLHTVTSSSDRDLIINERREWGMFVNVINDSKIYELKYNHVNSNIGDNNNWVEYITGGTNNGEWLRSVQEISSSPSTFSDNYRYLVDINATGLFSNHDNKIAVYNSANSSFTFSIPLNGQTLRVDNVKNVIFKYEGTYSSGKWVREYLSQNRYLTLTGNGLSYSATSSGFSTIDTYSYSVFYCDFGTANAGTVSISVDSLPYIEVKKLQNNSFSSLVANEIQTGIKYQLILNDGGFFQTILPSSTNTTIGPAEDGYYTDGLFTDFTTSTPIGTAVDRFNEILKALVPSSAPNLSSLSAQGSFVVGGVSFDNSTSGSLVTATSSPYGPVPKGTIFTGASSSFRLGITSKVNQPITGNQFYQDITGILNSSVLQSTQSPIPAYVTYSFGNGLTGSISLILNGITVSNIGLTGCAVDSTNSGATSGLNISASTSSFFPSGAPFNTFQNRTGTFLIKRDNTNIVDGYNYLIVRHDTPSTSYVLNRYEWIADSSTASISFVSPQITNVNTPTRKFLSGIGYYTGNIRLTYGVTLNNVFSNTYNTSNTALTYRDVSSSLSTTNTVTNTVTNSEASNIFNPSITIISLVPNGSFDPSATLVSSMTFSVNINRRRVNDPIGFAVTVQKTVQGTFSGATSSVGPINNWFIDTYGTASTNNSELFDDEVYRLKYLKNWDKYDYYHTLQQFVDLWDSTLSLYTIGDNDNGLQVTNGLLLYPKFNFSGVGSATTNPNFGIGSIVDYTNCANSYTGYGTYSGSALTTNRTYLRYFNFVRDVNYSKAKLNITYQNTNFTNANQTLSGNNLWIEIKLPYDTNFVGVVPGGTQSSGSVTGWLDLTKPFSSGQYSDGSGCYEGSLPTSSGQDWLINFGIKGTLYSRGFVLLRITAPSSWTGNITSIQLVGRV